MQAIEFWSVLAEIELLLKEEEEELDGVSSHVETECKKFLERCATELVPKLLDMLTLQNEEQDDEDTEWYAWVHFVARRCGSWQTDAAPHAAMTCYLSMQNTSCGMRSAVVHLVASMLWLLFNRHTHVAGTSAWLRLSA